MTLIDKKFISNARVNYVAQLLGMGLGFISVTLLVKFGGLELYGMMAVMLALGATVTNLISFRTNEALVRFYKRGASKSNHELQYFSVSAGLCLDIVTGLALLTIIQIFAEAIGLYLLKSTTQQDAISLFSLMASANFLRGTGYGLLTAQEQFNAISVLGVLEQGIKVVCIGLGIWSLEDLQLHNIMLLIFISSIPFTFYYIFIAVKQLFTRPLRRWTRKKWVRLYWSFSLNTFISSTLKSGYKNMDAVILGYFSSPAMVGLYNLFKQFISPLNMLSAPYSSQIYPKFVDALSKKSLNLDRKSVV